MKPWDTFIGDSTKKYGASGVPLVRNISYGQLPKKILTPSQQAGINVLAKMGGLKAGDPPITTDELARRAGLQYL
jgi:hypothetical protein